MKNKQQLKNAILLLLALSLLAIYVYTKAQTRNTGAIQQTGNAQNTSVNTNTPTEQVNTGISNPTPKEPSGGGLPAPKPNQ
jgi:hypothetical protein